MSENEIKLGGIAWRDLTVDHADGLRVSTPGSWAGSPKAATWAATRITP